MIVRGPWLTAKVPPQEVVWVPLLRLPMWEDVSAQNGPGIAVVEHRPGPDLSASLDKTEEH